MTRRRKTRTASLSGERGLTPDTSLPTITGSGSGLRIGVRVSPSAPRTQLRGVYGDRLKVAVNAPPEDNRANQELVEALAGWLGLDRESVRIESGHASRDKVVSFTGVEEAQMRSKLITLLTGGRP
jgi:uncharacterized protein (TIGR00251 family)